MNAAKDSLFIIVAACRMSPAAWLAPSVARTPGVLQLGSCSPPPLGRLYLVLAGTHASIHSIVQVKTELMPGET